MATKKRCPVLREQKRFPATCLVDGFFLVSILAVEDAVTTAVSWRVQKEFKRAWHVDTINSNVFARRMFLKLIVPRNVKESCLAVITAMENVLKFAVNTNAKRWF